MRRDAIARRISLEAGHQDCDMGAKPPGQEPRIAKIELTPCNHHSTTDLLNRLHLQTPPWCSVLKVLGNGVLRAVGQGCGSLLPGLEVARINGARQIRQGFGGGSQSELDGTAGCLSAVAACLEH